MFAVGFRIFGDVSVVLCMCCCYCGVLSGVWIFVDCRRMVCWISCIFSKGVSALLLCLGSECTYFLGFSWRIIMIVEIFQIFQERLLNPHLGGITLEKHENNGSSRRSARSNALCRSSIRCWSSLEQHLQQNQAIGPLSRATLHSCTNKSMLLVAMQRH